MKKIFAVAALLVCMGSGAVFASSDTGSWAVGFQGIGNIYANGRPTLRWRKSDATSLDFTPTINVQDNGKTLSIERSNISSYGLTLGIVKHVSDVKSLRIGWVTNLNYTYNYENIDPKPTGAASYSYNNYTFSVGLGPDFEYFIPAFPRISIGAQAVAQYQYIASTTRTTAGAESAVVTQHFRSHSSNINLLGELFTVRYYF